MRSRFFHSLLGIMVVWLFGFLLYCAAIPAIVRNTETKVDGIVVLTGGAERLAVGIGLLKEHMAKEMLVTGVARNVDKTALVNALDPAKRPDPGLLSCCIFLGHEALSTADNANETKKWLAQRNIHSIRLVTANYHINRSLLEFHRAMPEIEIIPNPVFPGEVLDPYWFTKPSILWLLVNEYHKSIAAFARAYIGDSISWISEIGTFDWVDPRSWFG